MKTTIIVIILFSFFVTSCCTVRHQEKQLIPISSDPSGATIIIDGMSAGLTPQTIPLQPDVSHKVVLIKEGFQTESYQLSSRASLKRLSSNVAIPIGLTAAGIGTGLCLVGGDCSDLGLLLVCGCGLCALAAGVIAGGIGVGVDLCSKKCNHLYPSEINASLKCN